MPMPARTRQRSNPLLGVIQYQTYQMSIDDTECSRAGLVAAVVERAASGNSRVAAGWLKESPW